MLRTQLFYLLITFSIISCAVNQHILNPEYKNLKINNKGLLIVKIDSSNFSINQSMYRDKSLVKEYYHIFEKSFESAISNISSFNLVATHKIKEPGMLTERVETLSDGEKIKLLLPQSGQLIYTENNYIMPYLLIISKLELTSAWIEVPFGPYEVGSRQVIHYAIWDNYSSKLVCYGKSDVADQIIGHLSDPITTKHFIEQNARLIISNSPFKR